MKISERMKSELYKAFTDEVIKDVLALDNEVYIEEESTLGWVVGRIKELHKDIELLNGKG